MSQQLRSAPRLAPLYARAVVWAAVPGGRGGDLPDRQLELHDLEVDRDHLARYDRVCGFRVGDELPPTYPHVLAFPLAMALMSERSFPLPLPGLVHVANRIDQRRPLRASERLTVRVWAADPRPHPRGRQFDLVAEAAADGEVAWSSRSTYLRRGGGGDGEREREPEPPGEDDAHAIWHVPGDIGRRYAAVSGDRNPIHLNGLAARALGVKGPIAHGMWMKARCLAALEGRIPAAARAEVHFKTPLRIPSKVRFADRSDGEWTFALLGKEPERPHLVGAVEPLT
jgi:acyl dehydratase